MQGIEDFLMGGFHAARFYFYYRDFNVRGELL
jgi:hypothetical protein